MRSGFMLRLDRIARGANAFISHFDFIAMSKNSFDDSAR